MSPASLAEISVWIDAVDSIPQDVPYTPTDRFAHDNYENPRPAKKRRIMDASYGDDLETPRPPKRSRDVAAGPRILPPSLHQFEPPSPRRTEPDAAVSDTVSLESHNSGRLSPTKQLQALEDSENSLVFCNFHDHEENEECVDVMRMRDMIREFADGIGILGYDDLEEVIPLILGAECKRFRYSWANDPGQRLLYGSMPSMRRLQELVTAGWRHDRGTGTSEDDWNANVQYPLIKLAHKTSKYAGQLAVHGVYVGSPPSVLQLTRR